MRNLILAVAAVVMVGTYTVMIRRLVIEKRKNRRRRQQEQEDLARYVRARGLLNLSDKPYMLPKQEGWQIRKAVEDHKKGYTAGICINHRCTEHLINTTEEIDVIQGKVDPKPEPRCDYKNRSHHVD